MTTFTDIMKRGEKSTQHEWGHWDLAKLLSYAPIPEVMVC